MRIYTRTGDKGLTKIFGNMSCKKDDIRIESNGKLDEANSFISTRRENGGLVRFLFRFDNAHLRQWRCV